MKTLYQPNLTELSNAALDITEPAVGVEILVNWQKKVLHVNVDGVCVLRICRIPHIDLNGGRDAQSIT